MSSWPSGGSSPIELVSLSIAASLLAGVMVYWLNAKVCVSDVISHEFNYLSLCFWYRVFFDPPNWTSALSKMQLEVESLFGARLHAIPTASAK